MTRPNGSSACVWLGLVLLATAATAGAGELYQWKDANGVTHYADAPPPDRAYQNRTIRDSRATGAPPKPAESAQCATARINLQHLQGTRPVGPDADGDGKPDSSFDATQRAAQITRTEAAVKLHCVPAVAAQD